MQISPWCVSNTPSSSLSESCPSAYLILLFISLQTLTAGLQAGGASAKEVRLPPHPGAQGVGDSGRQALKGTLPGGVGGQARGSAQQRQESTVCKLGVTSQEP